jgi:hypothetical protein
MSILERGARARVVGGKTAKGVTGTIFWIGDNKFGEGKRYGLKGDDGQTYWVPSEHVEADDKPAPAVVPAMSASPPGPALVRGDRVAWRAPDGDERWGEVFWVGASKRGDGAVRVGVKDPGGETLWFDASQLRVVDGAPPPSPRKVAAVAPADVPASPFDDDEPPPWDDEPGAAEASTDDDFFDGDAPPPDWDDGAPLG